MRQLNMSKIETLGIELQQTKLGRLLSAVVLLMGLYPFFLIIAGFIPLWPTAIAAIVFMDPKILLLSPFVLFNTAFIPVWLFNYVFTGSAHGSLFSSNCSYLETIITFITVMITSMLFMHLCVQMFI